MFVMQWNDFQNFNRSINFQVLHFDCKEHYTSLILPYHLSPYIKCEKVLGGFYSSDPIMVGLCIPATFDFAVMGVLFSDTDICLDKGNAFSKFPLISVPVVLCRCPQDLCFRTSADTLGRITSYLYKVWSHHDTAESFY